MKKRRLRRRARLGSHLAPPPKLLPYGRGLGDDGGEAAAPPRARKRVAACGPAISDTHRVQLCMKAARPGAQMHAASSACQLMRGAGHADRESFYALHLDARNQVIGIEEVARGTLTGVEVHPREVFKAAMLSNANALIIAHNHPSGNPTPSQADIELTERLIEVGKMLGMPILDHVIVTRDGCTSLRETRAGHGMFDGARLGRLRPRRGQFVR